jgi:hypothetical protein
MTVVIYTLIFVSSLLGIAVGFMCAATLIQTSDTKSSRKAEDRRGNKPKKRRRNSHQEINNSDVYIEEHAIESVTSDTNSVSMAEFESSLSGTPEPEIIMRRQKIEDDQYNMLKYFTEFNANNRNATENEAN